MEEYSIGHLTVDSPFGNAGGVVKRVEDVEKIAHTGVGWIEAGSYTMEPRAGNGANGEIVYYHNEETGETFNSLGMPNKGIDAVALDIPQMAEIAHGFGKPLVVNVAPVSDEPAGESIELVRRAYEAGADAVLLNAGCPNVVTEDGGRHEILSHNADALGLVLRGLSAQFATDKARPIFIRTSPMFDGKGDMSIHKAFSILHVIRESGIIGAVFTPNTWPGHKPLDNDGRPILEVPGGVGGKSGPATVTSAAAETRATVSFLDSSGIDVVSSGGIVNGKELRYRLDSASAVAGAGTTFFYESGDWEHDVDKLLWEFQDNT
jgi:dihydroorotate dehydrogenase (fumarate)